MKNILIFVLTFGTSASLFAKDLSITDCMKKSDTSEMFACLKEAAQQEESKINSVYNDLQKMIKSKGEIERSKVLRDAERAWIKLSDNQCRYNVMSEGGEGEASTAAQMICNIQESIKRRYELAGMLQIEKDAAATAAATTN